MRKPFKGRLRRRRSALVPTRHMRMVARHVLSDSQVEPCSPPGRPCRVAAGSGQSSGWPSRALLPTAKIHLDLTGLDFIDIAAARELIALTQQPPCPRLILHDPPPALLSLIRLLWPEANVEFDLSPGKIVTATAKHEAGGKNEARR